MLLVFRISKTEIYPPELPWSLKGHNVLNSFMKQPVDAWCITTSRLQMTPNDFVYVRHSLFQLLRLSLAVQRSNWPLCLTTTWRCLEMAPLSAHLFRPVLMIPCTCIMYMFHTNHPRKMMWTTLMLVLCVRRRKTPKMIPSGTLKNLTKILLTSATVQHQPLWIPIHPLSEHGSQAVFTSLCSKVNGQFFPS
jgi:hypothetical protein